MEMLKTWGISACAACCMCASAVSSAEVHGVVVRVLAGDVLMISAGGYSLKLHLAHVDAPQPEQPYGHQARRSLAELCDGKEASIDELVLPRKRRIIARVHCAGLDVSAEQVRRGMAWVIPSDAEPGSPLYELERRARMAARGLWAEALPVPPWKWPVEK